MKRTDANHKSNQANPNNAAHHRANDNTSNQRNPTHLVYERSRAVNQVKKK